MDHPFLNAFSHMIEGDPLVKFNSGILRAPFYNLQGHFCFLILNISILFPSIITWMPFGSTFSCFAALKGEKAGGNINLVALPRKGQTNA